jgi:hypothetical protein
MWTHISLLITPTIELQLPQAHGWFQERQYSAQFSCQLHGKQV